MHTAYSQLHIKINSVHYWSGHGLQILCQIIFREF